MIAGHEDFLKPELLTFFVIFMKKFYPSYLRVILYPAQIRD
jgi:hypothetical protein